MNKNHMKKLFALLLAAAAMLTFTSVAQTCGTGKASQKIESFEIVTLRRKARMPKSLNMQYGIIKMKISACPRDKRCAALTRF